MSCSQNNRTQKPTSTETHLWRPPLTRESGVDDVVTFWFGHEHQQSCNSVGYLEDRWALWFRGQDVLFELGQRYGEDLVRRVAKRDDLGLEWWSPRGLLAQIVLLDQVSRCAFRSTSEAFAYDETACELARVIVEGTTWLDFLPIERFFVCLALSHAEDVSLNRLHVIAAKSISKGAPRQVVEFFASIPGFPDEHWDTIDRFGRFPHRNAVLGRRSTADEIEWLQAAPGWARSQSRARLVYWDGRGIGDPIRFLLEFCLIPYDEELVKTRAAFIARQQSLAFGQLPLLEIDGLSLVTTQAILRYVAGKKRLRGRTLAHEATADMVVNAIVDARMPLITARFQDHPGVVLKNFESSILPKLAHQLHVHILSNTGPYICGTDLTYADVFLFEFLEYAADECDILPVLDTFPELAYHRQRMRGFPHMLNYLDSQRRKPLPDDIFLREVCDILDRPLPAYLRESLDQDTE